jgi:polyribonucleotide nucleotidyltransferase
VKVFKQSFQFGDHEVALETGGIARQATGSVLVRVKDTVILVTAVVKSEPSTMGFFPLTVNYQERMYAAGRIPGGFLKREGRPSESETLICRLIDRPIRPLFPDGYMNEVQIVANVISFDPDVTPDIPAMIGASAALALSGAPFMGPIGAARVGFVDDHYILNPNKAQMENSKLDLVVAGTKDAVLMVESQADQLPEETMLGAVLFGHEQMQVAIQAINDLVKVAGKPKMPWQAPQENKALADAVKKAAEQELKAAYEIHEKQTRYAKLDEIKAALCEKLVSEAEDSPSQDDVLAAFGKLEKNHVRQTILNGELRIDGRDTRTVRPIRVEAGWLPRPHGSSLFTRGETQAIVTATLGNERDAQILDAMAGETRDAFMLHYNFPPYCVGETGMMGSPKRREIGHGNLARRAVTAILPSQEAFPYTIRVVSEITESNGSSSMATVCGSSLALMDAGVPVKAPVAGIAMGLIKEGDKYAVLSDILGDEDHLGDMDFKVAGSTTGVTALQMDIKITGITKEIMEKALEQAKEGRLHILGIMNEVINQPRKELSAHAPRIYTMKVAPEKLKEIIGKGGATIKGMTEKYGVSIDLEDDGTVKIFAADQTAAQGAIKEIEAIVAEAEIGATYEGKVVRLEDYGAFVNFMPNKDGLVHVSQISEERVENVSDHFDVGDTVRVKVLDIDRQGRVKLTMRDLDKLAEAPVEVVTDAEKAPVEADADQTKADTSGAEKKPTRRRSNSGNTAKRKPSSGTRKKPVKRPPAEDAADTNDSAE